MRGMGLLPCETEFTPSKARTCTAAKVLTGPFAGAAMEGYEIHMGRTKRLAGQPLCRLENGQEEGAMQGNVFGTYLHGLFDEGSLTEALASWLLARKGIAQEAFRLRATGNTSRASMTCWQMRYAPAWIWTRSIRLWGLQIPIKRNNAKHTERAALPKPANRALCAFYRGENEE